MRQGEEIFEGVPCHRKVFSVQAGEGVRGCPAEKFGEQSPRLPDGEKEFLLETVVPLAACSDPAHDTPEAMGGLGVKAELRQEGPPVLRLGALEQEREIGTPAELSAGGGLELVKEAGRRRVAHEHGE